MKSQILSKLIVAYRREKVKDPLDRPTQSKICRNDHVNI